MRQPGHHPLEAISKLLTYSAMPQFFRFNPGAMAAILIMKI
jgi:hypothetical protein